MHTAASTALAAFQARDVRADGASRHVAVDSRRVSIARRFQGIDMRVAVPVAAYAGVILRPGSAEQGSAYEICLAHRDPDLSVALCEAVDCAAGQSALRDWARYFELPVLTEEPALEEQDEAPQTCARRNRGVSNKRRPRFLARRVPGDLERIEIVHREDEIIAYD